MSQTTQRWWEKDLDAKFGGYLDCAYEEIEDANLGQEIYKFIASIEDETVKRLRGISTYTNEGKDELYCRFWRCNNCDNSSILEGSNFCSECGYALSSLTPEDRI